MSSSEVSSILKKRSKKLTLISGTRTGNLISSILVFRIKIPRKDYKFQLQAYDRDFFKSNDIIGEANINIRNLLEDCSLVKRPIQLNEKYYKDVLAKNNY